MPDRLDKIDHAAELRKVGASGTTLNIIEQAKDDLAKAYAAFDHMTVQLRDIVASLRQIDEADHYRLGKVYTPPAFSRQLSKGRVSEFDNLLAEANALSKQIVDNQATVFAKCSFAASSRLSADEIDAVVEKMNDDQLATLAVKLSQQVRRIAQ